MSMSSNTRITELADIIHRCTRKVETYIIDNHLPPPSFQPSTPAKLPDEVRESQRAILEATDELNALMLGPVNYVSSSRWTQTMSLQAIQRFGMARAFPVDSEASFSQISETCSLNESDTRRILRHAMSFYIFREPRKGIVSHTAGSAILATMPMVGQWIDFRTSETLPAVAHAVDAMQRWPASEEPNQAGFSIAHGTDKPMYADIATDEQRAKRLADGMTFKHAGKGSFAYLFSNYDWSSLTNGLVVDVGGSHGSAAVEIARALPNIRCVVQDLEEVLVGACAPADVKERITFQAADFLEEQPVKGANLYFLRSVLHNWSDKYAIKIIRNLIPALKPGAKILVNDNCLPEPDALSAYAQRPFRSYDLAMKALQNAKERDADEWVELFARADQRFVVKGVVQPAESRLALIDVRWETE